jgi:acetylglutamate kinase
VSRLLVKVGGAVAEQAAAHLGELIASADDVCVVHGAGPQISEEMERFGLEVEFVRGRRVTNAAALVLVRRSLARVNAALCAALGERSVGLFGDEIGLHATQVHELGLVGDPLPCRPPAVESALRAGRIPVVAPIGVGWAAGQALNVNADEAAAALAVGLRADRIVFVTDVPGVFLGGIVARTLVATEADRLLDEGGLEGGIVPKLRAAVTAARFGVRAQIGETAVLA